MTTWTDEHRKHVGGLVDAEIERAGLSPATAAARAGISTKTLERVRAGDPAVAAPTVVSVAEALGVAGEAVLPPRLAQEQAQLDRIETMLEALLAHHGLTLPAEPSLAGAADQTARRRAGTPPTPVADRPRRRPKGRAA